jgi:hypothetical protein
VTSRMMSNGVVECSIGNTRWEINGLGQNHHLSDGFKCSFQEHLIVTQCLYHFTGTLCLLILM